MFMIGASWQNEIAARGLQPPSDVFASFCTFSFFAFTQMEGERSGNERHEPPGSREIVLKFEQLART